MFKVIRANEVVMNKFLKLLAISTISLSTAAKVNEELLIALKSGAIVIETNDPVQVSPDLEEILKKINFNDERYEKPILIISNEGIIVNDKEKLNAALSSSPATITSL